MANVNHHRKGIGAKLAYFGPPGTGKSSNLEFLNKHTANPADLMSVPHPEGRTLSFFLPLEPHVVHGVELRLRVVTVQTRLETDKAWQQALRECDGVVFVADSRRGAVETTRRYVQRLADDLRAVGISPTGIPILLQLNWQDAADAMTADEAGAAINPNKWPIVAAAASQGFGVVDTAAAACRLVCKHLQKHFAEMGGAGELCDQVRVNVTAPAVELRRGGAAPAATPPSTPPPAPAEPEKVDEADVLVVTDEPPASVIVEPALLGVDAPPAPPAVEAEPELEAAAPALPPVDAAAALAALGHIRQCAADVQVRLGAGADLESRILATVDQLSALRDSAGNIAALLAALAAEQGQQPAPAALEEIPARLADVEALLGKYREKTESLEHALKSAETAAAAKQAALTAQLEAAKAVSAQLTRLDKNLEADLAKAKEEVEAARNDLATMRTASEQAAAEMVQVKADLEAALEKKAEAENARDEAEKKVAVAEEEKAAALQQLALAVSAGDALQAQLAAATAEAEPLRAQAASSQQQLEQLMTQVAEAQAAAEANAAAAAEAEPLRNQLVVMQQQLEQLVAQLAEAQSAAGAAAEAAELRQKVATLEEAIEGLRSYQQVALRLQQEIKEKDAKIAELGGARPAAAPAAAPAASASKPPSRPSSPTAPSKPPTPAAPRTSGAVPAATPQGTLASAAAAADPFAADPSHQTARRLAKGLITEFASRFLPGITEAVANGTFEQAFGAQLKGMRKAYDARVQPQVRETHDYLQDELQGLLAEVSKGK